MIQFSKFYTPVSLWDGFDADLPLQPTKLSEMRYDSIYYGEYCFSGRKTKKGRVRIYGALVVPDDGNKHDAVLFIPDISERFDYDAINEYVKLGYAVLTVDLYGRREGCEHYTVYPEDVFYANYETRGRAMDYVDRSAKETSWYEWVAVEKYALRFLRSLDNVGRIGILSVKNGANIAWQLAATEEDISASVMMFGAGWAAYHGIPRYSEKDIDMDEERRKFIAAVDAHAYAQYAKCPILYLSSTNNANFDCDRACDTLSRINPQTKYYFNFAPSYGVYLDTYCKKDIELFYDYYLRDGKEVFPACPDVTAEQDGNYLTLTLKFDESQKVAECKLYVNEGVIEPALRNWYACEETASSEGEKKFEYLIGGNAKQIFAFAVVRYQSGFSVSSRIVCKKIGEVVSRRANIIYSSRNGLEGIAFYDKNATDKNIFVSPSEFIQLVEGPGGIYGAYSQCGLISYKFGEPGCSFNENSILKTDVYCAEFCVLRLVLMAKTDNGIGEFSYVTEIKLRNIWQNVIVNAVDFKTADGMGIRKFENVFALRIESDSKFAVNNILLI